jgi:hypothetical protein
MRIPCVVIAAWLALAVMAQWAVADPVEWPGTGHWYEAITAPTLTWQEAGQAAAGRSWMDMPGHLATITSQEELDFIATWIPQQDFWLAGYQEPRASPPRR